MFWVFSRLFKILKQLVYTMLVHQNVEKIMRFYREKKLILLYHPQGHQAVLVRAAYLHQN